MGGQDQFVCNDEARSLYDSISVKDKKLIFYEEAEHSLMMDAEIWPLLARETI